MYNSCCVPGCSSKSNSRANSKNLSKRISMHRFPSDIEKRKRWLKFFGQSSSVNTRNLFICSLHFTEDCFEHKVFDSMPGQVWKPKLVTSAVPSIWNTTELGVPDQSGRSAVNTFRQIIQELTEVQVKCETSDSSSDYRVSPFADSSKNISPLSEDITTKIKLLEKTLIDQCNQLEEQDEIIAEQKRTIEELQTSAKERDKWVETLEKQNKELQTVQHYIVTEVGFPDGDENQKSQN